MNIDDPKLNSLLNLPTDFALRIDDKTVKTFSVKALSIYEAAQIREKIIQHKENTWRTELQEFSKLLDGPEKYKFITESYSKRPNFADVSDSLLDAHSIKLIVCAACKIDAIDFEKIIAFNDNQEKILDIYDKALGRVSVKSEEVKPEAVSADKPVASFPA